MKTERMHQKIGNNKLPPLQNKNRYKKKKKKIVKQNCGFLQKARNIASLITITLLQLLNSAASARTFFARDHFSSVQQGLHLSQMCLWTIRRKAKLTFNTCMQQMSVEAAKNSENECCINNFVLCSTQCQSWQCNLLFSDRSLNMETKKTSI